MALFATLPITYTQKPPSANAFRDKFSELSDDAWEAMWISTEREADISGIKFPGVPEQQLQSQIHGSATWEISIKEAFAFYRYVKSAIDLKASASGRFLDYGCGWGRIIRPFMRDFGKRPANSPSGRPKIVRA